MTSFKDPEKPIVYPYLGGMEGPLTAIEYPITGGMQDPLAWLPIHVAGTHYLIKERTLSRYFT